MNVYQELKVSEKFGPHYYSERSREMARRVTVDGLSLERAERLIRVLFATGDWPRTALDTFGIEEQAFARFIKHQVTTLRLMYADIPPQHEAAIATMLTHLFFCGVASGRGEGYSGDSGLNV